MKSTKVMKTGTAASRTVTYILAAAVLAACGDRDTGPAQGGSASVGAAGGSSAQPELIRLWADGTPAFGIFVPSER